jgi:hypothetical protein
MRGPLVVDSIVLVEPPIGQTLAIAVLTAPADPAETMDVQVVQPGAQVEQPIVQEQARPGDRPIAGQVQDLVVVRIRPEAVTPAAAVTLDTNNDGCCLDRPVPTMACPQAADKALACAGALLHAEFQ